MEIKTKPLARRMGRRFFVLKSCCKGITLTELIVVIFVIMVAVLSLTAVFNGLFDRVHQAWEGAVVIRVREGTQTYFVDPERGARKRYLRTLDAAVPGPCSPKNICFRYVLGQPIEPIAGKTTGAGSVSQVMNHWIKLTRQTYRSPVNKTNVWTYRPEDGSFTKTKE